MSGAAKAEFQQAVICDDVRREDNGKSILIGVYSHDIIVAKLPATFSLASYIVGTVTGVDEAKFETRVKVNNEVMHSGRGTIRITSRDNPYFTLVSPALPLEIAEEGELVLDAKIEGGRWKTLRHLKIKQAT